MKCNFCKIRINKWTEIKDWIKVFCCKSHKISFFAEKKRISNDKVKIRKVKKKEKKHNSISYLTKQLDNLWSQLVKINYNYTCQYCWKQENLNSHHLYTRSRRNTRFDLDNWICLCSWCHTLSSNFSAHQTSLEFAERIRELKWDDYINKLRDKSNIVKQWTSEELLEMIESYKNMLQNLH